MKTFVLSTLIAVATAGNTFANHAVEPHMDLVMGNESAENNKRIDAFKSQIAFHQRNVEVLWNQYSQAVERIRNSSGNHAELERDKDFFIGVYQQDIQNGVRVEESKRAIAEIEARYEQAHVERNAYEAKRIAVVHTQLKAELDKEVKKFEKAKQKNAELVNAETLPMLQEAEQYFAQSIERATQLAESGSEHTVAAR